jgi:hypothetical protein
MYVGSVALADIFTAFRLVVACSNESHLFKSAIFQQGLQKCDSYEHAITVIDSIKQ